MIEFECIWEDNLFTAEGTILHSKVDDDLPVESRGDVRITRGLLLRSLRLGLTGKADVVEFHRLDESVAPARSGEKAAIALKEVSGLWRPYPVDYKRGRLRHEEGFEVQVCAQALCLEEMLGVAVPAGAIYFGKPHRRLEVDFSESLRGKTEAAAARLHALIRSGITPQARYEKKCESCSLLEMCMPKVTGAGKKVGGYLSRMLSNF